MSSSGVIDSREEKVIPASTGLPSCADEEPGKQMHDWMTELYPFCRSITGRGLRQTLEFIAAKIPLTISEVATGTQVFDWQIPKEWTVREAWIKNSQGHKVVDFAQHNLHLVNYSSPIHRTMTLSELKPHLHTLPEKPDWIPYRTSYYNEDWGFCLSHKQLLSLEEDSYEVFVDTSLEDGALSYGELLLKGESEREFLFFAHCCHPSLCNDNLSGIVLLTKLAQLLAERELKFSYRFVFAPATIGSITWLSHNREKWPNIVGGLVAAVVGDEGRFHYKPSKRPADLINQIAEFVLDRSGVDYVMLPFSPWGYDERQFASPGISLPMGRLTRTPNGCYPEYHTSADNLDLVTAQAMSQSLAMYLSMVEAMEANVRYRNKAPFGEPQLGRRGLYRSMGGYQDIEELQHAILWLLNMSDGEHTLFDIARSANLSLEIMQKATNALRQVDLLEPLD